MPDALYDAITAAIAKPLNGDLFERCAVDLLRSAYYPSLRPVEGGNDAGMDGIGETSGGERFFLVSTVSEDVRANLERNIQSHLDAGGDRRAVVLATSRRVSGQRRIELSHLLYEQFGVHLLEVHDRGDFIPLLYRNPSWREEVLGVPGLARALTRIPTNRRPTPEIPLIGRDDDVSDLRERDGDLVLVGKPGIGKTFLLQRLMDEDWGLFDDGWSIDELENAIREMGPKRVVLDDAHLKEERLVVLRRLRSEMNADFGIVAISWPGQREEILETLPEASTVELQELDRDQILQVIQEVGVGGPRDLQAHLVSQSMGRAGLAVTLAYACVRGRVNDVARGDALLTDVVGWFSRSLGRESRHVLGVLALTGADGATMREVASILDLGITRVSDLMRGLASGGTVDEVSRIARVSRLRVQPESLRYALVRDVFFSGAGSLDIREAVARLDQPRSALLPLVGAAHRGADVGHDLLREVLDVNDASAVAAYALLGPAEAADALTLAPQHRSRIARVAYAAGVQPEIMLRVLLDDAVGDSRNEHSAPDHPLRIVDDHFAATENTIEARKRAIAVTDQWIRDGGDVLVGFRVFAHATKPIVRRVYSDPGFGNTITIAEGALPSTQLVELSEVWDSVLEIVAREGTASPGPILEALHPWVYPSTIGFGQGIDAESMTAILDEAIRVLSRLAEIMHDRPGVLRRLRDYATNAELEVRVDIPSDFAILFPSDWDGSDENDGHEGWSTRSAAAVRVLATALLERLPAEVALFLGHVEAEAANANITYPRLTPQLAELLAEQAQDPMLMLTSIEEHALSADLLFPFLDRVVREELPGWEGTLSRLLDDGRTSWVATHVTLSRPVGSLLKNKAIQQLDSRYRNLIEVLIARKELDSDTLECLLSAPDGLVARDTAVALGHRDSERSNLSVTGQAKWRETIVMSPADDYWYSVILRQDPDLFSDWLRAWFARIDDEAPHEHVPHTLLESISGLSVPLRETLIHAVPHNVPSFFLQDVVTELVGNDLSTTVALLNRADLDDLHWTALRNGPSEEWLGRALVAFQRGWTPERIVTWTTFSERGWSGEESLHWQEKVDAFLELNDQGSGDSPRSRIVAAGVALFAKQRDTAAERERHERVFGYD